MKTYIETDKEIPDWANFITYDSFGYVKYWEKRPTVTAGGLFYLDRDNIESKCEIAHSPRREPLCLEIKRE